MNWSILNLFLVAYFLGAISFAAIVAHFRGVDLREVGSGNLGATNVYRAFGLRTALFVFVLDVAKGFVPVYLCLEQFPTRYSLHLAVGLVAILGHSFSVFVKFKGGKGVATGLGVLLAIQPLVFSIVFLVSVFIILVFKMVAPASIVGCLLTPFLLWFFHEPNEYVIAVSVICMVIIWRHKANITRLFQGKENKI